MTAAISLLVLLFFMCGAQTRSTQPEVLTESVATAAADVSTQLDVYAELEEHRDMMRKQEIILEDFKKILKSSQDSVKVLEAEYVAVKDRLVASEGKVEALERELQKNKAEMKTEVDNLKKKNAAQEAELSAGKTRLTASETGIYDLKVENAAQKADLTAVKKGIKSGKVAFSSALDGFIHSGTTDLNVVFSKVITNEGEAYSSTTGFFTAPVRGVYYFRFTVMDILNSRRMTIRMFKNGRGLMSLYEQDTDGYLTYLSSGLTLQLEVGDVVNMVLPAGYRLDNNSDNHSTFSGFLVFPL